MPVREWFDAELWKRDGRGRHWEFALPTDAIIDILRRVAADTDDTLELLAGFREGSAGTWFSLYEARPLERLAPDEPWEYFVRSGRLTPAVPAPSPLQGVGWPAAFAVNGLVLLQHPDHARKADRSRSSIGVVNRVRHQQTGELREHYEYDELYAVIKRALAKG
jgi:hypothetical protein